MAVTSDPVASTGPHTLRLRTTRIRQRATDLGFGSVAEMAERFGITRQHMYKLLHGTYLPGICTAQRIATALGMAVEDLYDEA